MQAPHARLDASTFFLTNKSRDKQESHHQQHRGGSTPRNPAMNTSIPVATEVASVDFNHLTIDDIRALSVKQVVNPVTFAPAVPGSVPVPLPGGLYDPALGASDSLRQRYARSFPVQFNHFSER